MGRLKANLHGRRCDRTEREILKQRKGEITSLGILPGPILALVAHWHIENGRARSPDPLPGVCASLQVQSRCLTNVAIAIGDGRFTEANRHYAARAQDALDAILIAPDRPQAYHSRGPETAVESLPRSLAKVAAL